MGYLGGAKLFWVDIKFLLRELLTVLLSIKAFGTSTKTASKWEGADQ